MSRLSVADAIAAMLGHRDIPIRIEAFDGSSIGPTSGVPVARIATRRGLQYIVSAPGDLGLTRAYLMGDLEIVGEHPGDPYAVFAAVDRIRHHRAYRPSLATKLQIAAAIVPGNVRPGLPVPPQESPPGWKKLARGLRRHSHQRDLESVSHHYDVSNRFYEMILGDAMTYTCAVYPTADADPDVAQENKYRLVFEKLRLGPGARLLDVGCGWGGLVRYAARRGVRSIGVSLSAEQIVWANERIREEGLEDLAEMRHQDYRDVSERDFDAISSIGMTEHIGRAQYPHYFSRLAEYLRPGGMLLNHCITWPNDSHPNRSGATITRYVFPDAELAGVGLLLRPIQDAGFEVVHEENLRQHYALTLRDWSRNLVRHWDDAVAEVGDQMARLWALYLTGSRFGFETNVVQLHQVLAVRLHDDPRPRPLVPLRPWWTP